MTIELSEPTLSRLRALFFGSERDEAIKILLEECGDNLPLCENTTPEKCERIRYAVLKLSEGKISELKGAVEIAKTDWRDVLVAAGFGNSVTIHNDWWPKEGAN